MSASPAALLFLFFLLPSASAGTLSLPISGDPPAAAAAVPPHQRRSLLRPRAPAPQEVVSLNNISAAGYFATFNVGTPGQNLTFQLDTGSSDTWVNSVDADLCTSQAQQQLQGYCLRQYNPKASSTFRLVDRGGFNTSYLDGNSIQGDWFNDTITINDKPVRNQRLGLALRSNTTTGIMGLGFDTATSANQTYPTVVDNLVNQGIIDARVFSLYLNDLDAKSGTILFGGIDSQKFYGSLATLPLVSGPDASSSANDTINSFTVPIQGITLPGADVPDFSSGSGAILDSGATMCLLPDTQARPIQSRFGVIRVQVSPDAPPTPLVDCAYRGAKAGNAVLTFRFPGKSLQVPADEMVINSLPDDARMALRASSRFRDWQDVCLFGVDSTSSYGLRGSNFILLGDTFLRSAYVVYDLDNKQVGLAQSNLNSSKSNVVEMQKGATTFPNVAGLPGGPNFATSAAFRSNPPTAAILVPALLAAAISAVVPLSSS